MHALAAITVASSALIALLSAAYWTQPGTAHHAASDVATCAEHEVAHHQPSHVAALRKSKTREHAAFLNLAPSSAVTHAAVQSGPWSDPRTWRAGQLPATNAKVLIPGHTAVQLDAELDGSVLDWIRVDGCLLFQPGRNTALAVRTLIVTDNGRLQVGSRASPVAGHVKAQLNFAPRPGRDHRNDPLDLAGGLISSGAVEMVAAPKTSHQTTLSSLRRHTKALDFAELPAGWRVGDQVLVPGTDASVDEDEVRTIVGIAGRAIVLDRALDFDHVVPPGVSLPIGNLTRNIEVQSLASDSLAKRAHVMFMHAQSGTLLDGVAFLRLGRTAASVANTFPEIGPDDMTKPGSDANTIGRYAVHFHVRSGARADVAPHIVRNSVVMDSPKFGIVNHGGHVLVENNVTFRVAGAHLVAENGSEIGAFRGNMAVRSVGSGEIGGAAAAARMGIYDNAHAGHGIWLISGGVEVSDNWASGHAAGAIALLGMRFFESGEEVFFDAANAGNPSYADSKGRVGTGEINLYLARNTVGASRHGIEIWNHKDQSNHHELSVIEDTTVWNVQHVGVLVPYSNNVALRNVRLIGSGKAVGLDGNIWTDNLMVDGGSIQGFEVGMRLPSRGRNIIRNVVLENLVDLEIPLPNGPGRQIHLQNLTFTTGNQVGRTTIAMKEERVPVTAQGALLFADDRIDLTDRHGRNQRIFFPSQHRNHITFPNNGPEALRGLTNREIEQKFGLARGGTLAPENAVKLARSTALAAAVPVATGSQSEALAIQSNSQPKLFLIRVPDADLARRWENVQTESSRLAAEAAAFKRPEPKLALYPSLVPLQIHPDDLPYGFRVMIYSAEQIDQDVHVHTHIFTFHDLEPDPNGVIRVSRIVTTLAGTQVPLELDIRVTPEAVRRGSNLDFFMQRSYCGDCGLKEQEAMRQLAAGL